MEKEFLKEGYTTLTVNVAAGQVESLRRVVETTTTVRVYEDGNIGVAGQVGHADIDALTAEAIEHLADGVDYPVDFTKDTVIDIDTRKDFLDVDNFVALSKRLVQRIAEEVPAFTASNKLRYTEEWDEYSNTQGTRLSYRGNAYTFSLVFKDKNSANLMDMGIGFQHNEYDEDKIVHDVKYLADAYFRPVDIPAGKYKIILEPYELLGSFIQHLVGELYGVGVSLLSGKLGERIFSERLSLIADRTPGKNACQQFYDAEGVVNSDYISYFIKDGVLTSLLTTKKTAAKYGLPVCGTAAAAYDGVPSIGVSGFGLKDTGESLRELIGDDDAIYVNMASGGDMTPSGDFATPVQTAYLYRAGELVGRLPDLHIFGNVFEFLGEGFVGATHDTFHTIGDIPYCVVEMNVTK